MTLPAVLVAPGTLQAQQTVRLESAEQHHLRVRRVAAGTRVICLDGAGAVGHGAVGGDGAEVAVDAVAVVDSPPGLLVAVGAGDRDRFVALAERCTELGVTRLIPLDSAHARGVDTRVRESAIVRAQTRAREACKQSLNPWATIVDPVTPLTALEALSTLRWFMGAVEGDACPSLAAGAKVGWIIGPEGGLTVDEVNYCLNHLGARPVRLGAHVLRFDTAAIAAAALTADRRTSVEAP